jgi:hypothetical protein
MKVKSRFNHRGAACPCASHYIPLVFSKMLCIHLVDNKIFLPCTSHAHAHAHASFISTTTKPLPSALFELSILARNSAACASGRYFEVLEGQIQLYEQSPAFRKEILC